MFLSKLYSVLRFITQHPLNKNKKLRSFIRFLNWQLSSRFFFKKKKFKWIDDSILVAYRGEAAVTGNLYTGLLDFNEMSFLLHYLEQNDIFVDVGANSGVYTVLASKVVGCKSISIEPIKNSLERIKEHLKLNNIEKLVQLYNCGVGQKEDKLFITNQNDSTNRVVSKSSNDQNILCEIKSLNLILEKKNSYVVKIDTEGFEYNVLKGADKIFNRGDIHAVIIEMNGSGKAYGFSDEDIHLELLSYGFFPILYNPFSKTVTKQDIIKFDRGNVIYIKDVNRARINCLKSKKRIIHAVYKIKV